MKQILLLLSFFITCSFTLTAQVFDVDTIKYNGDVNKYINLVIMGDGYTARQQDTFLTHATNATNHFFTQAPLSNYTNYFNVFAIKVISAESGAKHPNTAPDCSTTFPTVPVTNPNTYFNSTFDAFNIHRLVVSNNVSNISAVLAANFPNYDQVLILVNSPYYGGSGGTFPAATVEASGFEILLHEYGHSFAGLADEYWAGAAFAFEKPNLTRQSNPALIKWKNWLTPGAGIGIHAHAADPSWFKPTIASCKMEFLGLPFCNVCKEAVIEKIHDLTNPIVRYAPTIPSINNSERFITFRLNELMKPVPNTLKITWNLDGAAVAKQVDSVRIDQNLLSNGAHQLTVSVLDTTSQSRSNSHAGAHLSTVQWTINKMTTAVNTISKNNKINYTFFPNPAGEMLNISIQLEKKSELSITLLSSDGKQLQNITNKTAQIGAYKTAVPIAHLPSGTYALLLEIDGVAHSQLFVKE